MQHIQKPHAWTKSQVAEAKHDFEHAMKCYFTEIWTPKRSAEYKGCTWEATSPVAVYGGLWRLCQAVKHRGGWRVFGKVELLESDTKLRFTLFYDDKKVVEVGA